MTAEARDQEAHMNRHFAEGTHPTEKANAEKAKQAKNVLRALKGANPSR